jgi:hypothetical protein
MFSNHIFYAISSICALLHFALAPSILLAQNPSIEVTKERYKINEPIRLVFGIDSKTDSIQAPVLLNFTVVAGPAKQTLISVKHGVLKHEERWSYTLLPKLSGTLTIDAFTFWKDGEAYATPATTLTILQAQMTKQEQQQVELEAFIQKAEKPTGTQRFVFHDGLGYVEYFDGAFWTYQRPLNHKERKKLRKISGERPQ